MMLWRISIVYCCIYLYFTIQIPLPIQFVVVNKSVTINSSRITQGNIVEVKYLWLSTRRAETRGTPTYAPLKTDDI